MTSQAFIISLYIHCLQKVYVYDRDDNTVCQDVEYSILKITQELILSRTKCTPRMSNRPGRVTEGRFDFVGVIDSFKLESLFLVIKICLLITIKCIFVALL
jgi:hypothetical protein